ncbi:unnamed protein product [Aphanomyces euteiches]
MDTQDRDVWYVVVNGQEEATSADKVKIPSNSDVADFRNAVHVKNSAILPGIVPLQLRVYANKAAFDRKDKPLGACDRIVEQLGKVDEMYVVVPSHDLVAVSDHLIIQDTLKNVVANYVRDVMREAKRHKSGTSRSVDGELAIRVLERNNSFVALKDKDGSVAIWGELEQEKVTAFSSESLLVEFVTPFLAAILKDFGIVFVNSENNPWLRQHVDAKSSTVCKPDGFATHAGMYRRNGNLRFGKMEPKLLDCMMIIEVKLSITDDSFGQVISYIQFVQDKLIEDDCRFCSDAATPVLLFDRQVFWLISSYRGGPVRVQTMKWIQPGSKEVLANFVQSEIPIWILLLNDACAKHGVSVVEGESFLGSGAFSRVFKVKSPNHAEPLALKILPNKSRGRVPSLHSERQRLEDAAKSHVAVTPVGDCKILLGGLARSLLLTPVGTPISRSELKHVQVLRSIFVALCQLHQAHCEHGDPRVENLIRHERKLLWVDFMSSSLASSPPLDQELIKGDIECLVRSVLILSHDSAIPQTVQPLVDQYINDPTAERAQALADGVHAVGQ